MLQVVPISRPTAPWNPSLYQAPAFRPHLAQAVVTTPTTPPGASVMLVPDKADFIDSAVISALLSGLGATAYGVLSYAFEQSKRPAWSKIFFGIGILFAGKAIWDISQIRER